jgi:uncharacterized protein YidB (DUF937 family)
MELQDVLAKLGGNQGHQGGLDNIQQLFGASGASGGGLGGIIQLLNNKGLGQQVESWIGSGQNRPISGSDVQQAVDSNQLQQMAQQQGMSPEEYSNHVATALPDAVDRATPQGMVPQQAQGSSLRSLLKL